jgi:peptide/nickel transport system substrate-binding protein
MPRLHRLVLFISLGVLLLGACAAPSPSAPPSQGGAAPRTEPQAQPSRTMVMVARGQPDNLIGKEVLQVTGLSFSTVPRLFNAELAIFDGREVPRPYLVENLPQLNTDTWRVFPDGRMETIYKLRPGLTWHDGAPLTTEDFVFSWRVYSMPEFGQSNSPPLDQMEQVVAVDPQTVLFRWKALYPDAGMVGAEGRTFPPLPRHILESSFQQDPPETFGRNPFWTTEYVGVGPYRLVRWEQGAFLEGAAFDKHAWGKPKIDRVRVLFISDQNSALANVLSGEAQIAVDDAVRFQQGAVLKREWVARNAGTVLTTPDQWRRTEIQHRPAYANPRGLLDVRVRRALAHSVDKQAINEGLFEGEALIADSFMAPTIDYYAEIDRAIAKYPFDPRRSEQLMNEAGWTKGPDGIFTHPAEGRFSANLQVNAAAQQEAEMAIMGSVWRQAGFDIKEVPVPQAQSRLGEVRGSFPAFYTGAGGVGERSFVNFDSTRVPNPENRWVGANRGGWVHADYDRLLNVYGTTLERTERVRHVVQLARIFTEEVAAISLYFNPGIVPHVSALVGPQPFSPDADVAWNVHEWELR